MSWFGDDSFEAQSYEEVNNASDSPHPDEKVMAAAAYIASQEYGRWRNESPEQAQESAKIAAEGLVSKAVDGKDSFYDVETLKGKARQAVSEALAQNE